MNVLGPVKSSRVLQSPNTTETKSNLLKTFAKLCTPQKLSPTPKGSCFCVEDVLFDPFSWEISRLPTTKTPNWTIFFWTTSSKMLFTKPKLPGERLLPKPFCWECQPPAFPQPWPSMMATALLNSQLT